MENGNGKLKIEGLKELLDLWIKFQKEVDASAQSMATIIKMSEKVNAAELTNAKTLTELAKKQAINTKEENDSAIAKQKLIKAQNEAELSAKKVAGAVEKLSKEQLLQITINNSAEGSYNRLTAQMSLNQMKLKAMSEEQRKLTKEGQYLEKQTFEINQKLKDLDATVGVSKRKVGEYENATKAIRQEMRDLTMVITNAKLSQTENTDEVIKAKQRLGELKDAMSDTAMEAKILGSDTKKLDMAVGIFKGIGSAAQVAEGATALFGAESEEVTRSIQKMMAMQSMLNGVQEIGNALQKESSFMMGLMALQSKIAAGGQALYAAAVGTSTGAMKLFRLALLATGIGAIIVGIGMLVANWEKLSEVIMGSTKNLEKFNAANAKINTELSIKNKFIQDEIDLLKAKGASQEEISKKERELLTNNIEYTKKSLSEIEMQKEKSKGKDFLRLKITEQGLKNSLAEQKRQLILFDVQIETQKREANKKLSEEDKKEQENLNVEKKKLNDNLNKELFDQNIKAKKDWYSQSLQLMTDSLAEEDKILQADNEKYKEDLQKQIDSELKTRQKYEQRAAELKAEYLLKSNEELMAMEMANLETLHSNALLSEEEYQQAKDAIKEKYRNKEIEDVAAALAVINTMTAMATDIVGGFKEAETTRLDTENKKQSSQLEAEYQQRIAWAGNDAEKKKEIDEQYNRDKEKLQNDFERKKAEISKKWAAKELTLTLATIWGQIGVGIAKAWAFQGWNPLTVGLAIAQSALLTGVGVAQSSSAKAKYDQAMSGYKKGGKTDKDDFAILHGQELVTMPTGERFMTPGGINDPLLTALPANTVITPAHLVENELYKSIQGNKAEKDISFAYLLNDIKGELQKANKRELLSVNVNANGVYTQRGNSRTKYVNKIYLGRV